MKDTLVRYAGLKNSNSRKKLYLDGMKLHGPDGNEISGNTPVETYKRLVGDLHYLEDRTCPDLDFIVGKMGSGNHEPTKRHWAMLKITLIYLERTK